VLGEPTGRDIPDRTLTIGPGATIRSGTILYLGSSIGKGFETGHYTIVREENEIGDDVQIWSHTVIDYGCTLGAKVHLHSNIYVAQYSILEEGVFMAPGCVLLNDPHPGCAFSRQCMRGPTIGKNAVIGGGCTILPMITIGAGAIIGGGSVVTRDIPAGAVAYGVPARVHGKREDLECWTGHTVMAYPLEALARKKRGKR
jgi:acetyltransferase-like isoleucine patch superfamily enzyme